METPGRAVDASQPRTVEGYLHEMGVYGSDEEFRDLICPFALGGLEAGEPVVFAYDPYKMDLLRQWLPDDPSFTFVTDTGPYATPAKALVGWRKLVKGHLEVGAPRVRIAGNVPHPGYGRSYAGWDRYEAAIDRALGDLPVWAPCLYDERIAPLDVLETARQRHHHFLERDGAHRANSAFDPVERLADFLSPDLDPLESTTPALELVDPTPAQARAAARQLSDEILDLDQAHELTFALSEAVTNAFVHGVPPVTVRFWAGAERIVVNVHDNGEGPVDPLAGLVPGQDHPTSGSGLWIAHRLDIDVAIVVSGAGCTVRLRAGRD